MVEGLVPVEVAVAEAGLVMLVMGLDVVEEENLKVGVILWCPGDTMLRQFLKTLKLILT
jgi:hypothetical protein